jgi:hypothetical protein
MEYNASYMSMFGRMGSWIISIGVGIGEYSRPWPVARTIVPAPLFAYGAISISQLHFLETANAVLPQGI